MTRGRLGWAMGLAAVLLGTVSCSGATVSATPRLTTASPSSSASASPNPSPTASSTPTASSKPPAATSKLKLLIVPGYNYTDLPDEVKESTDGLEATGMVSATLGRGVQDGSGNLVATIVLAQYNPKLTVLMEMKSPSEILDGPTPTMVLTFLGAYLEAGAKG